VVTKVSDKFIASIFRVKENGGDKFIRNVGNDLQGFPEDHIPYFRHRKNLSDTVPIIVES
jgi:hypothetical protein